MKKLKTLARLVAETLLCTLALPFVIFFAVCSWYSTNLDKIFNV